MMPQNFSQFSRLWLGGDCIYIQLGEKDPTNDELKGDQKAVVFDYIRKKHYTPENDAARLILDVLTQNKNEGVSFGDITENLLENFQIDRSDAEQYLNEFLNDLDTEKLLGYDNQNPVPVGILKEYKGRNKPEHAAKGKIKHGGTIIC